MSKFCPLRTKYKIIFFVWMKIKDFILQVHSFMCDELWCCGVCSTFISLMQHLWPLVGSWIGFSAADAHTLSVHFVQFTYSAGGLRLRKSFLQLVWLTCVWVVWNERNLKVFRNSANSVHQLLDKVETFSYRWMRTTTATLAINYHCWWSNPLLCLGIN
jgi:hypothetical protein